MLNFLGTRFQLFGDSLNALPSPFDMSKLCVCLTNTKPQGESIVHAGMRQVKITTLVETIHELLVDLVSSTMPKTNQIQRWLNS